MRLSYLTIIVYISYIQNTVCQRAINDTEGWHNASHVLADEEDHNAPNTTHESDTIIINLANNNAIKPAHLLNYSDPDQRNQNEQQLLQQFQDGPLGEELNSDIKFNETMSEEDEGMGQSLFVTPQDADQGYEVEYDPSSGGYQEDPTQFVMYTCPDPLEFDYIPGVPRSYIFNELSKQEILSIGDYISSKLGFWWQGSDDKTVTHETLPRPNDTNMLVGIQLYPPRKSEAILYLDAETDTPPSRFAKATIARGIEQDVMEYLIGPLPLRDGEVIWEQLTIPNTIPYAKRPQTGIGTAWSQYVIGQTAFSLRQIFKDMTNGYCYGLTYWAQNPDQATQQYTKSKNECGVEDEWKVDWLSYPLAPSNVSDTMVQRITRIHWYFFPANETYKFSHGDEGELHPLPISFTINETDTDYLAWNAYDFEYCGQYFETKEDLLDAYIDNQNIYKCGAPEWGEEDYDWSWSSTYEEDRWTHRQKRVPSDKITGPRTYEPEGQRFLIVGDDTAEGRRFAWMGWEGHFTMRPDTGLAFYDIRYNQERIIYELALQDQYVAYSGFTGAGQVVYFDSNFGMGMTTNALKHGVDCPETAAYFTQTKLYSNGAVWADVDVVCMFEADMAETEWRHTHSGATKLEGIRRTELVIRSISTIGNYDYIYDIRFKLDASIDVQIHMAGYMEALFFDPLQNIHRDMPFGTRVGKNTLANIHDHLSGWKVDFDIKGRNNSFEKQTVRYGTYEEAFSKYSSAIPEDKREPPKWFSNLKLKYIDLEKLETEQGLVINSSEPAVWHFINEAKPNKQGNPNGYAVIPANTHMQLMADDHPFLQAAAWTKYNLAITRHHDHEYVSHSSNYDTYMSNVPIRSLDKYLNEENIVNEDLVGWVMVGIVHVPRTEDVPLISNLGIGFHIKPWNYFDELPSMSVMERTNFTMECVPQTGQYFDYIWAMDAN
eukprot:TRINITY_DN4386_c1_g1_i3.p1 TRINITY_DN4386_c1_g1~~TRINITY_DN4386_c1_g1_i3.p1  ORF type:complete len:942 (+),score=92.97 TRINITY_DN4386_c1_g1_i3:198-3023(+)